MLLLLTYVAVLVHGCYITGSYAISGLPATRGLCFDHEQEGCDQEFTDVYKNLSKSVEGSKADTYFLLYTRKNKDNPEKLHKCGGRLPPNSNYDPNNRIIMIFLSFMSEWCDLKVYRDWKDELLKKEDVNIIAVDNLWDPTLYDVACKDIKIAAKQTIVVLNNIKEQTKADSLDVTILAVSLGSQLAGYIGRDFKVKKIIALDPAGPNFPEDSPLDERLDPSDAEFVEVMHCNAGDHNPFLGINYNAGHRDYWMNGGTVQNACLKTSLDAFEHLDILYGFGTAVGPNACYHLQCTKYFEASINNCTFKGTECESYEKFSVGECSCGSNGEKCSTFGETPKDITQKHERYYVKTTDDYPFCENSDKNQMVGDGNSFTTPTSRVKKCGSMKQKKKHYKKL